MASFCKGEEGAQSHFWPQSRKLVTAREYEASSLTPEPRLFHHETLQIISLLWKTFPDPWIGPFPQLLRVAVTGRGHDGLELTQTPTPASLGAGSRPNTVLLSINFDVQKSCKDGTERSRITSSSLPRCWHLTAPCTLVQMERPPLARYC